MRTGSRAVALLLTGAVGCGGTWWRATFFKPPASTPVDLSAPFLKCHMADGGLYVLRDWRVEPEPRVVSGTGVLYDADRRKVGEGPFRIPFEAIALAETNRPETVTRTDIVVLGVVAGASLAVTAACLANPKACFGSCPTFYLPGRSGETLQAEGFSASVARAYEATDVDALEPARPLGSDLEIGMRNEALETHRVRSVRLLAVPRPPGGRAYQSPRGFFSSRAQHAPRSCRSAEGDCLEAVRAADEVEYRSAAGERDLAEQETMELTFSEAAGRAGLVVRARNTLLNTFVFYQGLAFLGSRAGEWMASLERGEGPARAFAELERLLATVEVSVLTARGWVEAGSFSEVGPIALDTQLVPLPSDRPAGDVRVRLRLTRGNWKIDLLALAEIGEPVVPVPIPPSEVRRAGAPDPEALARLRGQGPRLATYPGDEYRLRFEVPPALADAEIFLESSGYYLEWMREQWLAEEDAAEATRLALDLRSELRRLAPRYKRIEPDMERIFWSSRLGSGR